MDTLKTDKEICKGVNDFLRPDHLLSEENKMFCETIRRFVGYSKEGKMEKLLRDMKITQIVVGGQLLRLTELAGYYFGTETI